MVVDQIIEGEFPIFGPEDRIILGVDEAGRGPVLGPMVYGLAYAPETSDLTEVVDSKLDDSKKLTVEQRNKMYATIKSKIGWIANILTADYLSRKMCGTRKVSLNVISEQATIAMVKKVMEQRPEMRISGLYVDTVGDPERYKRNLQYIFPQIATIRVEKKADSLFKIVSAASVVAKVTRDTHLQSFEFIEQRFLALAEHFSGSSTKEGLPATKKIEEKDTMEVDDTTAGLSSPAEKRRKLDLSEELKSDKEENHLDDESIVGAKKDKVGIEIVTRSFGSGYPGDKETISWMEKNVHRVFGFPRIVRFCWDTTDKMMERLCCRVEHYEDPEKEDVPRRKKSHIPARKTAPFVNRGISVISGADW